MPTITGKTCDALREDINAALKSVGEKYGLQISAVGNATYSPTCVDFKVRAVDTQAHWNECISSINLLNPDDLGKSIVLQGTPMTIIGFDEKAKTNKVLMDGADGKHYHAPVYLVADALKQADPSRALTAAPAPAAPPVETPAVDVPKMPGTFISKLLDMRLYGKVKYGQTFVYNKKTYKVVDINTKAKVYPIVGEAADGDKIRVNLDYLRAHPGPMGGV